MKIQEKVLKKILCIDNRDRFKVEEAVIETLAEVEKIIDELEPITNNQSVEKGINQYRYSLKQKLKGEGK